MYLINTPSVVVKIDIIKNIIKNINKRKYEEVF